MPAARRRRMPEGRNRPRQLYAFTIAQMAKGFGIPRDTLRSASDRGVVKLWDFGSLLEYYERRKAMQLKKEARKTNGTVEGGTNSDGVSDEETECGTELVDSRGGPRAEEHGDEFDESE